MIEGINWSDPYNYVGTLGASLVLLGFYRISVGRWTNRSLLYELDNLLGAVLLITYQLHNHTYVTLVLNIIWAIVAFRGISSFAERYADANKRKQKQKLKRRH